MTSSILTRRNPTPIASSQSHSPFLTYQDQATADMELQARTSSLAETNSLLSAPPPYPSSSSGFNPTVHLQIQAQGKPCLSLSLPPKPEPIPVFDVDPQNGVLSASPRYISIRPERRSGSGYLVAGGDGEETVLSRTTYRFGPGRPPVVSLFPPPSHQARQNSANNRPGEEEEEEKEDDHDDNEDREPWDSFSVVSSSLLSRTQVLRHTRLGTFVWRYARRSERRELEQGLGLGCCCVLVLERTVRVALAEGRDEEVRRTVGLFVRGAGTRTPGSGAGSAGNGGRLVLDLAAWEEEGADKVEREMAVVMAVTGAIVMLKKEVDRG